MALQGDGLSAFCKGRLIYRAGYGPLEIERCVQNVLLKSGRNYFHDRGKYGRLVRLLCSCIIRSERSSQHACIICLTETWPLILHTTALCVIMDIAI